MSEHVSPAIPAELAGLIALHREMFGGMFMEVSEDPPETPPNDPQDAPPVGGEDEKLGEAGMKALRAEREAHRKAKADLAALQKQIDDAQKTEAERASDALREAQEAATKAQREALRYRVAATKTGGELKRALTLAERLVGDTEEELAADLDKLLAELGAATPPPPGMKPDPSAGRSGDITPRSLAEALEAHYS